MPSFPLAERLPDPATPDALLEAFLEYVADLGIEPYPAQEEAILELLGGRSVVLNTPTGSGKSLVATSLSFKALAEGKRCFYTAPIKALVSEKFFSAARTFGPENVGMMTGDASVNRDAPIVYCTAEILANIALREQADAPVDYVIMDEFHYYGDRDRGWAWQVPMLTLKHARFLLMSATLGDPEHFRKLLEENTTGEAALVKSQDRPVPLSFTYAETPIHETVAELMEQDRAPIYMVHFTQRSAAEQAQSLMSVDFLSKAQKHAIKERLKGFRFDTPFGKELGRYVRHGVGVHHAGLLPKYRLLVESLAQDGHLKIICGTDTLGVGVNIPIRTVLFTQLCKYDGRKTAVLSVRDFQQIAGRAGRRGFDTEGYVVAQAPEHEIHNLSLRRKAQGDSKKLRKTKFRKPPDFGYAHWDEAAFQRLIDGTPERLPSRFQVNHGMMMQILDREDGMGCRALKTLIRESHEPKKRKFHHGRTAIGLFRSLEGAGIVDIVKAKGRTYVDVNADLQEDFSLNHSLSLFVVEILEKLDPEDDDYAFDVISMVEATLEDPGVVLRKQLDKRRGDRLAELKAEGMEYDERIEELDKVTIEQPRLELILDHYEEFRKRHPWVRAETVRPKSVAREILEKGMGFRDFVKEYGLARSEGVLLRYLSDAYKSVVQNVPEDMKDDFLYDLTDDLGAVVREVDSSLLEEWERMKDPEAAPAPVEEAPEERGPVDITADRRGFTAMVRNAAARFVRHLALRRFEDAAEAIETAEGISPAFTFSILDTAMAPYFAAHEALRFDPEARSPKYLQIEEGAEAWSVRQILVDPEGHNEWSFDARVDLARAREEGRPILELRRLGETGA
jgi:superfamily II RNA helicase